MVVPCELCGKPATDRHHLFSQTKWARKLYGKLLDRGENIMYLCNLCHLNKPIPKLTEREFAERLGINVRSKLGGGYGKG